MLLSVCGRHSFFWFFIKYFPRSAPIRAFWERVCGGAQSSRSWFDSYPCVFGIFWEHLCSLLHTQATPGFHFTLYLSSWRPDSQGSPLPLPLDLLLIKISRLIIFVLIISFSFILSVSTSNKLTGLRQVGTTVCCFSARAQDLLHENATKGWQSASTAALPSVSIVHFAFFLTAIAVRSFLPLNAFMHYYTLHGKL